VIIFIFFLFSRSGAMINKQDFHCRKRKRKRRKRKRKNEER